MTEPGTRRASRRRIRRAACLLVAWVAASVPASAPAQEATAGSSSGLVDVDRLAIPPNGSAWTGSGWLVLNPRTRRAYQLFETTSGTVMESFDLDTLAPRRRLELSGLPIPLGRRDGHLGAGVANASAEPLHAVDEEAGIVYLALADLNNPVNRAGTSLAQNSESPDARLIPTRWVAIDEAALDAGREAVASFKEPAGQPQLRTYWPMGMEVDRSRTATAPDGRRVGTLLLFFAQPNNSEAPTHLHELVRWDPSGLLTPSAAERDTVGAADFARDAGRRVLDVCRASTVTGGSGYNSAGAGGQWGMLVRRDEIALVCHPSYKSASVVVVGLEADGDLPAAGGLAVFPLGKPVYDTVVDRASGRLLLRSTTGDGETWWVFDTTTRRFAGSLAAKVRDTGSMVTGLNQGNGRFYMLLADYNTTFAGHERSVRGGLHFADTRLFDPVAFENARPDLAYPAFTAIRVDPVTRRVFVRRGKGGGGSCARYPNTQSVDTCPPEPYYRVLRDTTPVPGEPAEGDDAAFTTDVAEADGVTRASYLGGGSGFGVRSLVVGGFSEAMRLGNFSPADQSPCGRDDRWIAAGSAGPVAVSDLSTTAIAASLDADIGTQKVMAAPLSSCILGWPATVDTDEFAFDRRSNQPPYAHDPDGDGVNDYQVDCIGDEAEKPPPVQRRLRRDGFVAEVVCDQPDSQATASATGELTTGLPPASPGTPQGIADQYNALSKAWDGQTGGIRVARGRSEVKVTRKLGTGIVTTVDSWARGVVIPGVGEIGAVRAEATVRAAGTPGTARARFERTICDVDFGGFQHLGCLDLEKDGVVARLNEAAAGTAEFRLRNPDPKLERGSRSGFRAAVQRDRLDRFGDRIIARDESLAVPALEIVVYRGTGREVVQLAGVEASVSYGLACLYGQRPDGKCAGDGDSFGLPDEAQTTIGPDGEVITIYEEVEGGDGISAAASGSASSSNGFKEPRIVRLIKRIPDLVADALRLIFSNPREAGLIAAVWALLYAPCYLGERRRSINALRARREAVVQRA